MAILVALNHKTEYHFDRSVALAPHTIRLRPAAHCRTPIRSYSLRVEPSGHFLNWQQDPFGNYLARLVFPEKARSLSVEVDVVAEMITINPFDFFVDEYAYHYPFAYDAQLTKELAPYLEIKDQGPKFDAWVKSIDRTRRETVYFLVDLNKRLQELIGYVVRMETGIQSSEETLTLGRGSCRDTGWLLVQTLRRLGLAARFVSGYLVQLTADVKALDGPSGPEEDFTDLHAWAEVYIPGAGWVGLDPTSGLFAGEGHIPLACTPDPVSAAPITGATDDCEVEFYFHNRVKRIHEDPRVTKPYTDEQWASIESLGHAIDAELSQQDVRLTMGGEPTFVSIDDMEGAEWNIAALGPTKKGLAEELLLRLKRQFSPGGMLHLGQGKWYPGEQLPRWALSCYWRKDGAPVWQDEALMGDERGDRGQGPEQAERFIRTLATKLGVDSDHAQPAHEDVFYYLWREARLPANVDPLDSKLKDPIERARLARLFSQGLDRVAGYALPLRWAGLTLDGQGQEILAPDSAGQAEPPAHKQRPHRQGGWVSGRWTLRDGNLFLIPGDSPMGYRLPLDALPYVPDGELDTHPPRDPFEPVAPLTSPRRASDSKGVPHAAYDEIAQRYSRLVEPNQPRQTINEQGLRPDELARRHGREALAEDHRQPLVEQASLPDDYPAKLVRTALCIEPREGRLYCFMPPLTHLEHWLELVAALEATAAETAQPIIIEGYEPPRDARLQKLAVTPDPGVIEVNVHPASSWDDLVRDTQILYEEARQTRLGTEKFMLDGRHTGTGGGNHVTLGGPTPADSPLLRKPDLIQSLITYWQHHPSLSYLFSGTFIGPTSQAPRVDEARDDSLYELAIAFQQMPAGQVTQPWIVDRVLRNLLVDVTGNTHRTEFCIDKLYSPDSASGRQGLVEFRAFEMPPHARMSLAQMLLLRALVARFWKQPYTRAPIRWGTELHDRFLLPHFVRQDFEDVICDLKRVGYAFESAWFDPFFEFRFPHYGDLVTANGIRLELRGAIEPWHVLGEEVTAQGTSRFVDSAVERMQIKVNGLTDARHVVSCNGRRLPLRPTGRKGESVAGVRFKAWSPPSGLHPTIPAQDPLIFDVVDLWNRASLGGCSYYVSHPGGRAEERFPVNSYEAESRRIARFRHMGHTPGDIDPPPEEPAGEHPYTLDLRWTPGCL
ncbi:transglutaminase family protein [Lamprobacter modestohalophilus]|uniref:transglutaminase family protein n=1 Tax=Lamprobacter modestohalophilus TaxID=1064514 RepID=UPI002ADEE030|nr:transglutaminase family protein [Lamprobacter modestohalophilus]MEA1049801.1 transglutaminase family protein [Lamprobacter modestohalophilus]